MKSAPKDPIFKHVGIAFALAVAGYVLLYSCDSRLRTQKGPWTVDFQTTTNQEPLLVINQPALGNEKVRILLAVETAPNRQDGVRFEHPAALPTPYGRVRFHDLTYLPGTITLDLFGHEVEMLPRALFLNTREVAWSNHSTHVLLATNKIPGLKDRDRKGRR